jgi:hypothetical protein
MSIQVEVIADITDVDLAAVNGLIPQLSRSAPPLSADALKQIVSWDGNYLLIARDGDRAVGMLTLVTFPIPTGLRAWIEDVALTQEAVRRARAVGARTVDLTSRPTRQAANRLYERLGFELRETNAYRFATEA